MINSHSVKYDYRFREEIKICDPLICCGGSLRPSDMDNCVIKVKPTSSEAGRNNWREFVLSDFSFNELLEYCNPAPFGDISKRNENSA